MTDDAARNAGSDAPAAGTRPRIEAHPTVDGLRLVDPIEGSQFTLLTSRPVEPTAVDTDDFHFPVDVAAAVPVSELETPYLVDVWIRDDQGELVSQCTQGDTASVPPARYNVEVAPAGMKLYLAVEGGLSVDTSGDRVRLSVSGASSVTVGVRSKHERPAATVTTTDDPQDLMRAVSTFGSALKTTTCERSFPTLRGHPPLLERGDALDIPDALDSPETGVRIEVPPEHRYVYPVVSLAYYLGARVVPGEVPRLVAGGERFSLAADGSFESTVARVLKQVFLLDCVTRTEGYYSVDLHERQVVEPGVDFDFASLYDRSLAEQVRTYLSVPYEAVADAVPRWKLTADVVPEPEHAETLPFLANDLAVVRCPDCADIESRAIHSGQVTVADFFGESSSTSRGLARSSQYRSETGEENPFDEFVFRPPPTDSIEQAYVGEGIPLGASKMTVEAYRRRLDYEPTTDTRTSVTVVCNEDEMSQENVVSDIYGTREWMEFDISIRENLTTSEMAEVLRTDADFLHYVGHVDPEGIRCADGWLDVHTLEEVGITSFLLNACKSYDQGRALVEAGALGGIVTVTDVLNRTAGRLGKTIAKLLDSGFSLASGLEILEKKSITANQYLIVGDGNAMVVESESGTPVLLEIGSISEEVCELTISGYPSRKFALGSFHRPYFADNKTRYLNSGVIDRFVGNRSDLAEFLSLDSNPIEYDGSLYWSDNFEPVRFMDPR